MRRHLKRRLALLVALAAVLAGGTAVALAATGKHAGRHHLHSHHTRGARLQAGRAQGAQSLVAAAAAYLGATPTELRSQLRSGKTLAQIAAGTPGRTKSGLVAALLAAAKQRLGERSSDATPRIEKLVNGAPALRRAPSARRAEVRAAVLSYLGISWKDLVAKRRAGMTLAQIAGSIPGRSEAGLRAAVLTALEQRTQDRAAARPLTRTSGKSHRSRLEARVTQILHRHRTGAAGRASAAH